MTPSLGVDIAAPAEVVWDDLVELAAWPQWGPTVRSARLDDGAERLHPGATGRVETVVGVGLPFRIDHFSVTEERRSWSWRVAGLPATGHRVITTGPRDCRLEMSVPLWGLPYLGVVRLALTRIRERAEGGGSQG